jgi:hypothetical protein
MAAILFKWCIVTALSFVHPFYVSVTEINHNAKDKTLEISCKLFAEDFEKTLETSGKTEVDLTHPKNKEQVNKLVSDYLMKHLFLKVDGKPVVIEFVGFEKENEAVWCFMQVEGVNSLKRLDAVDKILYESYDSQINIMHVTVNGNRKSNKVTNPEAEMSFGF